MVNLCVTKVAMSFDNQSFILDGFMILAAATRYFFIAQSTLLELNSSNLTLDHQVSIF